MSAPGSRAWWLALWRCFAGAVATHRSELDDLDAAIGDGDHGTNLHRGLERSLLSLDAAASPRGALRGVAMALLGTVGGASGALWGYGWTKAAQHASDEPDGGSVAEVLRVLSAFGDAVIERGKADIGDKTMVDVLVPGLSALREAVEAGVDFGAAAVQAARIAADAAGATTPLVARKGRASYLGERSAGHEDPGAASMALFFGCLKEV